MKCWYTNLNGFVEVIMDTTKITETSQTLIDLLLSNTPEGLMNSNLAKKQYLVEIMKTTTEQKLLNETQDFAYDKNYPNST